jgi:hypothetical protein
MVAALPTNGSLERLWRYEEGDLGTLIDDGKRQNQMLVENIIRESLTVRRKPTITSVMGTTASAGDTTQATRRDLSPRIGDSMNSGTIVIHRRLICPFQTSKFSSLGVLEVYW